ncbi:hypothetical protein NPX79_03755 [Spiroplasma endosymbiont of Anurida maritima]|uniref:hypothetical protein n=1 Tax=Spiroplasma endosymbiont of Anurida maritima TaxID=2967972 RepID=UPI0036D27497
MQKEFLFMTNSRGKLIVTSNAIGKVVEKEVESFCKEATLDSVHCKRIDENYLHLFIYLKVIKDANLNLLQESITKNVNRQLANSLKIKPKNLSLIFKK